MAHQVTLKAQSRQDTGKNVTRKMRATGRIPAVVYGHGEQTRMLSVDAHEVELLFKRVHWENTIIELDIEGERAPVRTLIREVQNHAHKPFIFHVDFQQIHAGESLHVQVPVRLIGNAPGLKAGGVMMQTITDLNVRCTPDNIPDSIDVDVSGLQINDAIHLRDIQLPEGVEAEVDADQTICSVTPPAVAAAAPESDVQGGEPELVKPRKED